MEANLKLFWKALVNAYDAGWTLVMINLLWFVLLFLAISLVILIMALLPPVISWFVLIIPVYAIPALMGGLAYYTHLLAHGESTNWKDFFFGMKKCFWPSMRYFLANLVVVFLVLFYIRLLNSMHISWAPTLVGVIYGISIIWLLLTPLVFPLMLEQEKPSLRTAVRNCVVMILKWPGITLIVLILVYILIIGSTYIIMPWIFLTGSFCSYLLAYIVMVKVEESIRLSNPVKEEEKLS
jgi:hypothetical protein